MYHEKFLTLGKTDAAPAQKATISVIDVMVTAILLVLIVFPILVSRSSELAVSARPDIKINISSTPIPVIKRKSKHIIDTNVYNTIEV